MTNSVGKHETTAPESVHYLDGVHPEGLAPQSAAYFTFCGRCRGLHNL